MRQVTPGAVRDAQYTKLWAEAQAAAQAAAETENARLGNEGSRGFDCGFAWIRFPGNIPFARWTKAKGISSKDYPSGQSIWYSNLHSVQTQSVSVHEAACRAAYDVLARGLECREMSVGSRLD
jgi:hypothetical protein